MRKTYASMILAGTLSLSTAAMADVILVDYATIVGGGVQSADNWPGELNTWNVYGGTWTNGVRQTLSNTLGDNTGITMTLTNFNGYGGSTWGITALDGGLGLLSNGYASVDGLFVNANATGSVVIANLNPALTYDITLFAARSNGTDRFTFFTAIGDTTQSDSIQTSGAGSGSAYNWNDDDTLTFSLQPNALGDIVIQAHGHTIDDINGPTTFGYLNSMQISAIPEPGTLSLMLTALLVGARLLMRRRA